MSNSYLLSWRESRLLLTHLIELAYYNILQAISSKEYELYCTLFEAELIEKCIQLFKSISTIEIRDQ